jgi:2-polyprenyl-6-methoxyphenol hydroxylase-like FAD-dependent oxidoreductase
MPRTPSSILICGAGIAGPALAYWLARTGFEVTIVEHAATPRPGGQAIDIRGAARDVVGRMGVLEGIKAAALNEHGFAFVDEHGAHQASMPVDFLGGKGIVAELEILRGELSRLLCESTRDHAEYRFDDSIESLDQDDNGVHVTFVNSSPRDFDLVVGADGVHSRTRALAFDEEESRWVAPLGGYTAYFTLPFSVETENWFLMHNVAGGRLIGVRPGGPQAVQVMLSFLSPPRGYERQSASTQKELLREVFAGVGWLAPSILSELPSARDFYFDLIAQVRMERFTCGRVALVGDAGYSPSPVTGLGTSLALVGAYVLAGELARSCGAYDVAFARYESVMRPYVNQCQALPPGGLEGMLPRTRRAIWIRNLSMRMMTRWPVRNLVAGLFQKADAIALEDYVTSAPAELTMAAAL